MLPAVGHGEAQLYPREVPVTQCYSDTCPKLHEQAAAGPAGDLSPPVRGKTKSPIESGRFHLEEYFWSFCHDLGCVAVCRR